MPSRLRPTSSLATDAILVGDPGRALLLAQELLEQPKMSNHARGLWGYSGQTPVGRGLTIQATGMGGPSAAIVLADLAKLGVRRAIRVGTCTGFAGRSQLGELLAVEEALAVGGSVSSFGLDVGDTATPEPELQAGLEAALGGEARTAIVASLDTAAGAGDELPDAVAVADMQTAAVLARAVQLDIAAAAVLIVSELDGERLSDERLEAAAKRAGHAATGALAAISNPQVEG
jgi:purine-nucleoside phosphorylase